jgi:hypothetical protein
LKHLFSEAQERRKGRRGGVEKRESEKCRGEREKERGIRITHIAISIDLNF